MCTFVRMGEWRPVNRLVVPGRADAMAWLFQHAALDPRGSIVIPEAVRPDEKKYCGQGGQNCQNRDELFFHGLVQLLKS
jgi:hypothetical protein